MNKTGSNLLVYLIFFMPFHLLNNCYALEKESAGSNCLCLDNIVQCEGATYQDFSTCLKDARVPQSAADVWMFSARYIDGHQIFIRYTAPQKDFIVACGEFCNDRNKVQDLPEIWPTADDMEFPGWFYMGKIDADFQAWLTIRAKPHSVVIEGKEVPCGYERAKGILVGRHVPTNTTYIFDFSFQWYRVGCGG